MNPLSAPRVSVSPEIQAQLFVVIGFDSESMKKKRILGCLGIGAISLSLIIPAIAVTADSSNPFQRIVERNVFRLKMPPPQPEVKLEQAALPKIVLTGVTSILKPSRVLMDVIKPAKPGEKADVQSLIFSVGERQSDIEVLEIDERADGGTVKLKNHGTVEVLSMDHDGAKLAAAAAPVALPSGGNFSPIPTRSLPQEQMGPQPHRPIPTNNGLGFRAADQTSSSDSDRQAIHMLAEHVDNSDRGIAMPPLPPPLTEVLDEGKQE